MWSDGCTGQFKSRHMLAYLTELVEGPLSKRSTRASDSKRLLSVIHNFFATAHGKGVCDAVGGIAKGDLEEAESEGQYLQGPEEAFKWLEENCTVEEDDSKGRFVRRFVYFKAADIPIERCDVKKIDGIKAHHSFMARRGQEHGDAEGIWMCEMSCYKCPFDGACVHVERGVRPVPKFKHATYLESMTRDRVFEGPQIFKQAGSVLKQCSKGDLVMVAVPHEERGNERWREDDESWYTLGRFRLAELAETPAPPSMQARKRRSVRQRARDNKLWVYFADERIPERYWYFPFNNACLKYTPESGAKCTRNKDRCHSKHPYEIPMQRVLHRVDRSKLEEGKDAEGNDVRIWVDGEGATHIRIDDSYLAEVVTALGMPPLDDSGEADASR
jgi:hypothetical protein